MCLDQHHDYPAILEATKGKTPYRKNKKAITANVNVCNSKQTSKPVHHDYPNRSDQQSLYGFILTGSIFSWLRMCVSLIGVMLIKMNERGIISVWRARYGSNVIYYDTYISPTARTGWGHPPGPAKEEYTILKNLGVNKNATTPSDYVNMTCYIYCKFAATLLN